MFTSEILRILNIGNTHIQAVLADPASGQFTTEENLLTAEITRIPEKWRQLPLAVSSVVPAWSRQIADIGAFIVSPQNPLPFKPSDLDMTTVGADRLANAAALLEGALPALSIDFGTAITFEHVNECYQFTGGAILPGRTMIRRAFRDYTAQLPLIPLSNDLPALPGTNTADAMRIGTDLAVIGAVRELIMLWKQQGVRRIVACGGDRHFFLKYLGNNMEDGGDFFTIRGIKDLWEYANHAR